MQKFNVMLVVIISAMCSTPASAGVDCEGPIQNGNTWNLVCSDDGTKDAGYQCQYTISLTTEAGFTDTVNASGSVDQGAVDTVIWSEISHNGSNVVSANIVSGSCRPW